MKTLAIIYALVAAFTLTLTFVFAKKDQREYEK